MHSSLAGAVKNNEIIQATLQDYNRYFRFALPYLAEKDNIKESIGPVTKEETLKWKNFLKAKREHDNVNVGRK